MKLKYYSTLEDAAQATIQEAQTALRDTLDRMSEGYERQHYTAEDRRETKQKLSDALEIEAEVCHRVSAYPALLAACQAALAVTQITDAIPEGIDKQLRAAIKAAKPSTKKGKSNEEPYEEPYEPTNYFNAEGIVTHRI